MPKKSASPYYPERLVITTGEIIEIELKNGAKLQIMVGDDRIEIFANRYKEFSILPGVANLCYVRTTM